MAQWTQLKPYLFSDGRVLPLTIFLVLEAGGDLTTAPSLDDI